MSAAGRAKSWTVALDHSAMSPLIFEVKSRYRNAVRSALTELGMPTVSDSQDLGDSMTDGWLGNYEWFATPLLDGLVWQLRWHNAYPDEEGAQYGEQLQDGMWVIGARPLHVLIRLLGLAEPRQAPEGVTDWGSPSDLLAEAAAQAANDKESLTRRAEELACDLSYPGDMLRFAWDLYGDAVLPPVQERYRVGTGYRYGTGWFLKQIPGTGLWGELGLNRSEQQEFEAAGLSPQEAASWKGLGVHAANLRRLLQQYGTDALRRWLTAGVKPDEKLLEMGVDLEQAVALKEAGCPDHLLLKFFEAGGDADKFRRYQDAGLDPLEAEWYCRKGIDPSEAGQWKALGIDSLELGLGRTRRIRGLVPSTRSDPDEYRKFLEAGLLAEEAQAYCAAGVDNHEARQWRALGFHHSQALDFRKSRPWAVESARQAIAAGKTVAEILEARAGSTIPIGRGSVPPGPSSVSGPSDPRRSGVPLPIPARDKASGLMERMSYPFHYDLRRHHPDRLSTAAGFTWTASISPAEMLAGMPNVYLILDWTMAADVLAADGAWNRDAHTIEVLRFVHKEAAYATLESGKVGGSLEAFDEGFQRLLKAAYDEELPPPGMSLLTAMTWAEDADSITRAILSNLRSRGREREAALVVKCHPFAEEPEAHSYIQFLWKARTLVAEVRADHSYWEIKWPNDEADGFVALGFSRPPESGRYGYAANFAMEVQHFEADRAVKAAVRAVKEVMRPPPDESITVEQLDLAPHDDVAGYYDQAAPTARALARVNLPARLQDASEALETEQQVTGATAGVDLMTALQRDARTSHFARWAVRAHLDEYLARMYPITVLVPPTGTLDLLLEGKLPTTWEAAILFHVIEQVVDPEMIPMDERVLPTPAGCRLAISPGPEGVLIGGNAVWAHNAQRIVGDNGIAWLISAPVGLPPVLEDLIGS